MKNSDKPINPIVSSEGFISHQSILERETHQQFLTGLSKREYFAGLAMQGILANRELHICLFMDLESDKKIFPNINHQNAIAIHAIKEADELLKQLEKTK